MTPQKASQFGNVKVTLLGKTKTFKKRVRQHGKWHWVNEDRDLAKIRIEWPRSDHPGMLWGIELNPRAARDWLAACNIDAKDFFGKKEEK